jgi:hypothetical protein
MKSLFDVLIEAVKRGLSLAVRDDRLSIIPDYLLTADFANLLRAHKPELLQLLTLPFVIVQSEVLMKLWCSSLTKKPEINWYHRARNLEAFTRARSLPR